MTTKMFRLSVSAALLFLTAIQPIFADRVYLKNGSHFEAEVLEQNKNTVKIKRRIGGSSYAVTVLDAAAVERIEKGTEPQAPGTNDAAAQAEKIKKSFHDHAAVVIGLKGNVTALKPDGKKWEPLHKGDRILAGYQIRTDVDSSAEIAYDLSRKNSARIGPETIAEVEGLEPTRLSLSDGSIYSGLDGMIPDTQYQIATPTSVAASRGTRYATVYRREDQESTTMVLQGSVLNVIYDPAGNVLASREIPKGYVMSISVDLIAANKIPDPRPMTQEEKQSLGQEANSLQKIVEMYIDEPEDELEIASVDTHFN